MHNNKCQVHDMKYTIPILQGIDITETIQKLQGAYLIRCIIGAMRYAMPGQQIIVDVRCWIYLYCVGSKCASKVIFELSKKILIQIFIGIHTDPQTLWKVEREESNGRMFAWMNGLWLLNLHVHYNKVKSMVKVYSMFAKWSQVVTSNRQLGNPQVLPKCRLSVVTLAVVGLEVVRFRGVGVAVVGLAVIDLR